MSDPRLDALLRDLPPPPPVPAGLQARVLAAAAGTPQEAHPARARRIAARRHRRGGWLRRPLFAGTAAFGLVFTSAVAATLAGVPIPQKIAAVFFPEEKAPEPKAAPAPAPRRMARPVAPPAAPVETAGVEPEGPLADAIFRPNARPWRRLMMAQRVIEARRAMGLPTPGADRIERELRRRARMWREATPEQRAQWLQRRQERQAERRALLATPEGRAALAERRAQSGSGQRPGWIAGSPPGMALTPEQRVERQEQLRQWRAQRQAGIQPTLEQRAERQAQIRHWREQQQAGAPPADAQGTARHERFRQWREARRARWHAREGQRQAQPQQPTEGPEQADR
jgi:hypothetical protein